MAAVGAGALASMRAVFGSRVPADKESALAMLDSSPAKPADAAALAAIRAAVLEHAGAELRDLEQAAQLTAHSAPSGTGQRPLPGALSVRLQQMTGAGDGLDRVVSPARAQALFDQLASDPDVPHDFIDDGCHWRAHVGAKALEDAGVYSEKAFLVPDGGDLVMERADHPVGFTLAMFHTAPAIWVRDEQGQLERRILDPSMGDKPLTLEEWQATMHSTNGQPCNLHYLPRFASHLMDRDDPPESWRPKDLEDANAWNTQYAEVQKQMEEMGFYDHLVEMRKMAEEAAGG
jgi:hypothetical protein